MNYQWTVLFLVHAANKQTRDHVRTLIEILKKTSYNPKVKVLVLYGALQNSNAGGVKIQVTLHELTNDSGNGTLNFTEVSPGYGSIDIGDDKMLRPILSKIRDKYPSKRFLLFTWDHGSGFGVFKTDPRERGLSARSTFLDFEMDSMQNGNGRAPLIPAENIEFNVINTLFPDGRKNEEISRARGAEKKSIDTSMLTIDEIRNTLLYRPNAPKVDLLIMMNCLMQMIETGYALHDAVDYLIAPETCIFWAGYDYKSIINRLCAEPDIETETLGRFVLDTIESYYATTPSRAFFNDLVVSMVRPSRSAHVKSVIDELVPLLTSKLSHSFKEITETREHCEDLSGKYVAGEPYYYIDFLNYIGKLGELTGDLPLEKLKHAVSAYVVQIIKGKNYRAVNSQTNIGEVNGCSIYHPVTSHDAEKDYYYRWFYKAGYQQTLFAAECTWKKYLQNYFLQDRGYSHNDKA